MQKLSFPFTLIILISLFSVPLDVQAADGGQSSAISGGWFGYMSPTNVALLLTQSVTQMGRNLLARGGSFDGAVDRNLPKLKKTFEEAVGDVVKKDGSLDKAMDSASEKLNKAFKEAVDEATKENGSLDKAMDRASEKLSGSFKKAIDDVTKEGEELDKLSQRVVAELAQNIGKMFLSSTMGIFGAVLAYKGLIDYLEAQSNVQKLYAQWRDQQKESHKHNECAGAAHLLSKKLHEIGLIKAEGKQQAGIYVAGAGLTTFAAACGLCCYWIR